MFAMLHATDERSSSKPREITITSFCLSAMLGCGQLVFEPRRRLGAVDPGDTLEVITHDAGAAVDLPAWCRTTGHTLVSAEPPIYVIRRGTD